MILSSLAIVTFVIYLGCRSLIKLASNQVPQYRCRKIACIDYYVLIITLSILSNQSQRAWE